MEQTNITSINQDLKYHTVGSKYQRNLDIKDISKDIRSHLNKNFKGFKFSVRISRYSMGQSLDVSIKGFPKGFVLFSEYNLNCMKNGIEPDFYMSRKGKYSDEATMLRDYIEKVISSYNYNDSDSMTDYFNVNFYSNVTYCWQMERDLQNKIRG